MSAAHRGRINPYELTTLVQLFKLSAVQGEVTLTSGSLGETLGVTQQAASARLILLEAHEYIERKPSGRGFRIQLTMKGTEEVRSFYAELSGAISEAGRGLDFEGTVFTGLGEGGYYVSQRGYAKQFVRTLRFKPFPGTLNLRLRSVSQKERRRRLQFMSGVEIGGFRDRTRTFGPVKCFPAVIEGNHPGAALAIERTHYDSSVLELISPENLRESLKLEDGDECSVSVSVSNAEGLPGT